VSVKVRGEDEILWVGCVIESVGRRGLSSKSARHMYVQIHNKMDAEEQEDHEKDATGRHRRENHGHMLREV